MATVGTRDLKQNPLAVVRRVLETGEPLEVTTHGHPTGVALVPAAPTPRRWVHGAELTRITPMSPDEARRFRDDLSALEHDDELVDPWGKPA
ncbi:type II toxin-antitoxin system Phd/YefM family antitoxin [Cellulomonas wangsupingiae]|uniref:Type II toxin-antitoxin system Phd/YefM family antitoxin n=1 Tax=Cellulomonas wangsupingiae TaxID=2968085 RepID=A0ABY5K950_9CELL|nr:type II toxin-antitoxin system Phd/YefM family antitoxin [Cellulomonas wangsupingiae]MCC2335109.1 type II toxin-antitoxin system Phd/YefM family antitoxin [Cellulomonas wangsupingiae]MCM0638979.1 type II toxin-antitoxin system Phd/YefM family antitoxin [Cellulomonas wangsupingiae]UUI65605.1 type II toxin-antitoxin system Phd/YefM family antitoxin [Cellulomonas wangsupingiae]